MLKTDVNIHLDCTLPLSKLNVNNIIALGQKSQLSRILVEELLNNCQQQLMDRYLGLRYHSLPETQDMFRCPQCRCATFVRRGSRSRKLKTSLGPLNFRLYQITCVRCRSTFSPFLKLLTLNPRQRIAEELEYKLIDLAKDLSYHQSANKLKLLTPTRISAYAIHRIAQRRSRLLGFHTSYNPRILIMDSTKVKASDKKYQDNLNIAIGVNRRYKKSNRYFNEKCLLALNCSAPWYKLDDYLKDKQPRYVLFDGDPEIVNLSERLFPQATKQWCIWHVPRVIFKKTLWIDRMEYKKRGPWISRLKGILYNYSAQTSVLKEQLNAYIEDAINTKLEETGRYLKANQKYFFNYNSQAAHRLKEDFHFHKPLVASGVIERLMREIKRRAKNGVRWTYAGLINLLKLKLIAEYNQEQYRAIWNFEKEQIPLNCLNVKIT